MAENGEPEVSREAALAYTLRRCTDYYGAIDWEPILPQSLAEGFLRHLAGQGSTAAALVRAWESVELFLFCLASTPDAPDRLDGLRQEQLAYWVQRLIPDALGPGLTRTDLARFLRHVAALYAFLGEHAREPDREALVEAARAARELAEGMAGETGSEGASEHSSC